MNKADKNSINTVKLYESKLHSMLSPLIYKINIFKKIRLK
jgi:hypothetical protein